MSDAITITEDRIHEASRSRDPNAGQVAQVDRDAWPQLEVVSEQAWLDEAVKQLQAIAALREDWDGNGASAPHLEILAGGLSLLACLQQIPGIPKPHVNPTRDGGVQFEWEVGPRYFEIEVVARGAAAYFYQDEAAGIEREGEIFVDEPLNGILLHIGQVARGD